MPFPQVVKLNVTGARGVQGAKGDPGGDGNSVASKAALAAIQGGATNKVVINSVAITAPGNYNSDGTAGTAGDDILVQGITA